MSLRRATAISIKVCPPSRRAAPARLYGVVAQAPRPLFTPAALFSLCARRHSLSSSFFHRRFSSNAVSSSHSSAHAQPAKDAKSQKGLVLTPQFVQRMRALNKKYGKEQKLRVSVEGGGCSGMQYKFKLVDDGDDEDVFFTRDGVFAVVDPVSLQYIDGSALTFEDELIGGSGRSAFAVVENPNIESSCGCSVSFSPIQIP
eukprot:gb/GEZN01013853.1/.p1 GENE.gb/GEZN01013853.1/~~gb/GEZN01013853.1/.p1  ORF type:complete len:201 (+),score=24.59 gb/GEZN01013853.1/:26-628(+)